VNKAHAAIIAIALGVAAVAGTFAALETTSGGAQAASLSQSSDLTARKAQLDRAQARLERAANKRPPALPPLPSGRSAAGTLAVSQQSGPGSSAGEDDSLENEQEFEDDHGGHGDDD
jgi:hypothetical protein